MAKFIIVERTICDVISSTQAGPAPFTAPRQRREAMPWGKVSEGDADGDAVTENFPSLEKLRTRQMTSLPIRNSRAVAT
jgi:hypothetical protein